MIGSHHYQSPRLKEGDKVPTPFVSSYAYGPQPWVNLQRALPLVRLLKTDKGGKLINRYMHNYCV